MVKVTRRVSGVFRKLLRKTRHKLSSQTLLLIFICVWTFCLLYLLFLFFNESDHVNSSRSRADHQHEFVNKQGVHVIVGQYVGPSYSPEVISNVTKELLNTNNYNPVTGLGEDGTPVYITELEEARAKLLYQVNRFNLVASDKISVNRTLPDPRKQSCKSFRYDLSVLPQTSVIIVFHNEAWSTLLRTVHSVLNRSPHKLLAEIILVDDASERTFLNEPLERYIRQLQIESKVQIEIVRSRTRIGLVGARLLGTRRASAPVLTYLDAHVETTTGWLEPLLHRLTERPNSIVNPIIDVIHEQTFAYAKSVDLHWGAINWALHFRWFAIGRRQIQKNRLVNQLYMRNQSKNVNSSSLEQYLDSIEDGQQLPKQIKRPTTDLSSNLVRPFKSPMMAGGLFSIRRDYFEQLGLYDDQMLIWGGENIELSLRAWSCGGRVETHPCSHVAHVFRRSSPYAFPGGVAHVLYTNLARVLHVWMEPRYQLFFYLLNAPLRQFLLEDVRPTVDVIQTLKDRQFSQLWTLFTNRTLLESKFPNLNQRLELKSNLKCNGFEWFLRNVWPQSFFPLAGHFFGQLQTTDQFCAQIPSAEVGRSIGRLELVKCEHQAFAPQLFVQGQFDTLRTDEGLCVDIQPHNSTHARNSPLTLLPCTDSDRQKWIFAHNQLRHFQSRLCVQSHGSQLLLDNCSTSNARYRLQLKAADWWLWAIKADQNKL